MVNKVWYVYRIEFEDGTFYYGYRGTKKDPNDDFLIKYFSSSKRVTEKMKHVKYSGEILLIFQEQEVAYNTEQTVIFENFSNPLILNRACYFGRKGFGILSDVVKANMGQRTKERWAAARADPLYQEKMATRGEKRWTDKAKQEQVDRLTGVKRPKHSQKLKGRASSEKFLAFTNSPRSDQHKENIAKALTGKAKSEHHKKNLSKPKPLVVSRIHDRKPMTMGNYMNWVKKFNR